MTAFVYGVDGDYEVIEKWLKVISDQVGVAVFLIRKAYAKRSLTDVSTGLAQLSEGLTSASANVCGLTLEIFERIADMLHDQNEQNLKKRK